MNTPLISVCIPTYNGEIYLQEALDSIKKQTYQSLEVIISDDQSKDKTLSICQQFKSEVDFPVYIYTHQPSGIGANWNNSIDKANGEYIKMLFQDDVLEPNCIKVMFDYLQKNNLEIVISKRSIIDSFSQEITSGDWYNNYNDLQKATSLDTREFYIFSKKDINRINFNRFLYENIFGEPCVSLFSKKMYYKTGKWNIDLKQVLDYVYYLRVLKYYNIGIIGEKLVKFRVHDQQASNINYKNNVYEGGFIIRYIFKLFFFYFSFTKQQQLLKLRYPILGKVSFFKFKLFP
ncbi:glycosyltransferase [Empedobacter falsenii]